VTTDPWVVVGLDNGGTKNNATVLDSAGTFLVDRLIETPSCVQDGPEVAIECLARAFDDVLAMTGVSRADVRAVGLDTAGTGQCGRGDLVQGLHELLPAGLAQL
jgi:glucokinase